MPEPDCWNGDLVLFAHGYVAPNEKVAIPEDQLTLPDGTSLPALMNQLGFAFATSSYPVNGLAIKPGVADMVDLVSTFTAEEGAPGRVYLTGASEGGIVTALAVEQFPGVFSGGLATCGPVGDFQKQIDYWGDFRAVFDYFFPGLLPGSPVHVPDYVIEKWDTYYEPLVRAALRARPAAMDQLLKVTRAPFDPADPATKEETVLGILWYNVFATNDGVDKLGGRPFDNRNRLYAGSDHDFLLNLLVKRYGADPAAGLEIAANYETSGALAVPVVTLHTTGDPIIPYWHEPRYRLKTWLSGSGSLHRNLPVFRYGHCQFEPKDVLTAFGLLVLKVRGQEPAGLPQVLAAR
jgi:alpha-beta hydrolase superfamily lysophospholipase